MTNSVKNQSQINQSQIWGYSLLNCTIDGLIRSFEGQEGVKSYSNFREKKDRANELIFECVGKQKCLFYIRRQGNVRDTEEEILDLTIATDESEFTLPKRLKELDKTLGLRAALQKNGNGGLKILSTYLLPIGRGKKDAYAVPLNLQLVPNHYELVHIPPKTLAQIVKMPICGNHVPTEEQLRAWKAFLKVEERVAKARQFCVNFVNSYYDLKQREIALKININSATLDGDEENYINEDNFWERVRQAKNQEIKFSDVIPTEKIRRTSRQLGTIEKIDSERNIIHIRLEQDLIEYMATENYQLPTKGYLFFDAVGDIKQIQRKEKALEQLKQGRTQNPYLGDFLFDASQARPIEKTIKLQSQDLLLPAANPGQKASVEKVLSAEDLVLIQGPPGTGKTTVIAEICYQVALRGGRTLITSQANLAVDNALSRLVHSPAIRAVRKGKAEKVGEEGQPFLEDQVIGRWLENTAHDCENNLYQRWEKIQVLQGLLTNYERFREYYNSIKQFNYQQQKLKAEKSKLDSIFEEEERVYSQLIQTKQDMEYLMVDLENILNQPKRTKNISGHNLEIRKTLSRIRIHGVENNLSGNLSKSFQKKVAQAKNYMEQLGISCPEDDIFSLSLWLQENIAKEIEGFQATFSYAYDGTMAMADLVKMVKVFHKHSATLQQLQKQFPHQNNHTYNLERTAQISIKDWENRQREINYIIDAIQEWKKNASAHIYDLVANSQTSEVLLTEEMLNLPLGLLMFAHQLQLPILPKNCQIKPPEWQALIKAMSYEVSAKCPNVKGKQYYFSEFIQQHFSQHFLLLQKGDRQKWQGIYQQFKKYQFLSNKQRQILVENTQSWLVQLEQTYGRERFNSSQAAAHYITQELIELVLTNSRQCILKLKKETEAQINNLNNLGNNLPKEESREIIDEQKVNSEQLTKAQAMVDKSKENVKNQLEQVVVILKQLYKQKNLPPKLKNITQECLAKPATIWEREPEFTQQVNLWENSITNLDNLQSGLNPLDLLAKIQEGLPEELIKITQDCEILWRKLEKAKDQLKEIAIKLATDIPHDLIREIKWWDIHLQDLPDKLKPKTPETDLLNLDFLDQIKTRFDIWHQELETQQNYLGKYQQFIQDWVAKLRQPSERDSNDLRQIYLDNANVVGITCVQAANYNFSEEFKYFDVVIIDEVSKCTPPELLIPALKAKKLVMVGDHRQLPPMIDSDTVEEVAQTMENSREEIRFVEESLFKFQFDKADDSIKQMLNTQYRMHPTIMGAINQFYHGKLECGILEADIKRAHNLAGNLLRPKDHLIWVTMPKEKQFQEQQLGTSFFNMAEIDVIQKICQQFEDNWWEKIANGKPRKEIAVITFYGAQLRKIEERLTPELFPSLHIRTGTVDRFQGMERPVVIVSMVRNNERGDVGFAKKPERVNVAFSRAQELLIIVGCHDLFTKNIGVVGGMYSQVANIVRRHGGFFDVSRFFE
jgi:DNA polymerase III delta prime subunit